MYHKALCEASYREVGQPELMDLGKSPASLYLILYLPSEFYSSLLFLRPPMIRPHWTLDAGLLSTQLLDRPYKNILVGQMTVFKLLPSSENLGRPLTFFEANCPSAFLVALVVKSPPANARGIRDVGSVPGSGRSLGGGHDNPLQYSCLENPMDRGAWQAMVHRVTKS